MGTDQQATHKQLGAKVKQLGLESDSDSVPFGDFTLKSTVAGLGMLAQARMEVGRVDDPAEVEADAMALDFLRWQQSSGQQSAPAHEQISSGQTSRSSSTGTMETGGFAVGGGVESEISRETGRGSGLDGSTRGQFEGFFGVDLGGVRLHADSKAAELSRSLGAEAFTVGNDVFFGEGRFTPGSSSGMGLLAHELTHVVQQGGSSMRRVDPNAVSLSRSPLAGTQMIRRKHPPGVVKQTEAAASVAGSSAATQEFKGSDWRPSGDIDVEDPEGFKHGEGFALISSTMNTISYIEKLWKVFSEPSTTEEKIWTVFGGMKSAADLSKSACEAAKASSTLGGAALQVIPGLGLAISVISFADTLMNTFLPLLKARKSEKVVLDSLRAKVAGTADPAAKKALSLQIASMETIVSTSGREIGFAVVDMVAGFTMIVGQAATLGAGPFGAAVTLLGATLSLASSATKTVWEWISSHKAAKSKEAKGAAQTALTDSRTNFNKASENVTSKGKDATDDDRENLKKATDDLKKMEDAHDDAYMALVQSDAHSAYINVLDMAFAPLRETPPQTMDPGVMAMLSAHGVSDDFINRTRAEITANKAYAIDYGVAVDEAADLIAVGPPMTMEDRIKGWGSSIVKSFGRVKAWFKSFGGPEVLPEATVTSKYVEKEAAGMTSMLGQYVKKKTQQGTGGVKPPKVNDYLKGPFKSFVARVMSGATEQVEKDRRLGYIVISSVKAVKAALAGASSGGALIDMSTVQVDVTENSITVSYSNVSASAASQTGVVTAAATGPTVPTP